MVKYIFLIFIFSTTAAHSQNFVYQLNKLSIQKEYETLDSLVSYYEKNFKENKKYDSLLQVYIVKNRYIQKINGPLAADSSYSANIQYGANLLSQKNPHLLQLRVDRSENLLNIGEVQKASEVLDQVIELSKNTSSLNKVYSKAIAVKATSYLYKGDFTISKNLILNNYQKIKSTNDTLIYMSADNVLAYCYLYYEDQDSALIYVNNNLGYIENLFGKNHPNYGLTLSRLAGIYMSKEEFHTALSFAQKALKNLKSFYQETGNPTFYINEITQLALIFHRSGESSIAEDYGLLALKMYDIHRKDFPQDLSWEYNFLLEVGLNLSKEENLRSYYDSIIIYNQRNDQQLQNILTRSYLAEILLLEGNIDEAINLSKDQIKQLKAVNASPRELNFIRNTLVTALEQAGNYENYLAYAQDNYLKTSHDFGARHTETILAQSHVLDAYIKLNKENEARALLDTIYKNWCLPGVKSPSLSQCLPNKNFLSIIDPWAQYLGSKKNKDEYFDFLSEFMIYYDKALSIQSNQSSLLGDLNYIRSIFMPAINHSVQLNNKESIFYVEIIKGIYTRLMLKSALIPNDQSSEVTELHGITANFDIDQDIQVFEDLNEKFIHLKEYKDSLKNNDPEKYFAEYGLFQKHEIEQYIQNIDLQDNELMLEYFYSDSSLVVISYDGVTTKSYVLDKDKSKRVLDNYFIERSKSKSQELYALLLGKLDISSYDNLLIIPDEKLFYLNFEELIDENNEYILQSHKIRYAYSILTLALQKEISKKLLSNVSITSFTPGFSKELKSKYSNKNLIDTTWFQYLQQPFLLDLSEEFNAYPNSKIYNDSLATEHNFKTLRTPSSVLHIGTHGTFDDNSPLFSKLVFLAEDDEDGYLHTYELFNTEFKNDLVVLSACNTGTGNIENGHGVISIAQAFTHSGSPATVMTLWEVDEKATAEILKSFYKNLAKGQRKSSALRNAKLKYIDSSPAELRQPYYWAGLIILGNDDPITLSKSSVPLYMYLIVVLLILLIFIFFQTRSSSK